MRTFCTWYRQIRNGEFHSEPYEYGPFEIDDSELLAEPDNRGLACLVLGRGWGQNRWEAGGYTFIDFVTVDGVTTFTATDGGITYAMKITGDLNPAGPW